MKNFFIGVIVTSAFWIFLFAISDVPEYTLQIECKDPNTVYRKPGFI